MSYPLDFNRVKAPEQKASVSSGWA
ncbi:uncharacterized protein METZ01_LOCUS431495 [marine metagenome]|uniref:Uncharacterized protein n=1 Tax=marine metagenome TaxID=408172 RepID=A0A382Y758_9ZZZZ